MATETENTEERELTKKEARAEKKKREKEGAEERKKQRTSEKRKRRQEEKRRRAEKREEEERKRERKERKRRFKKGKIESPTDDADVDKPRKKKRKKKRLRKKKRGETDKEPTTEDTEKQPKQSEPKKKEPDELSLGVAEIKCFDWRDVHCCTWMQHTISETIKCVRYRRNVICPLVLLLSLAFYTMIGGICLWIIERHITIWSSDDYEDINLELLWMDRTLPKEEWKLKAKKLFEDLRFRQIEKRWTLFDSVWFCFGICTASKPANIVPRTIAGKIFTVIFAFVGIPLMIVVAEECIRIILRALRGLFLFLHGSCGFFFCILTGKSDKCPEYSPVSHENSISLPFAIGVFVVYAFFGSQILIRYPISSVDAFYYSFLAFSTISIDDMFYDSSRILCFFFFIIFGIALLDICLEGIGRNIKQKIDVCHVLEEEEPPTEGTGYNSGTSHTPFVSSDESR